MHEDFETFASEEPCEEWQECLIARAYVSGYESSIGLSEFNGWRDYLTPVTDRLSDAGLPQCIESIYLVLWHQRPQNVDMQVLCAACLLARLQAVLAIFVVSDVIRNCDATSMVWVDDAS